MIGFRVNVVKLEHWGVKIKGSDFRGRNLSRDKYAERIEWNNERYYLFFIVLILS